MFKFGPHSVFSVTSLSKPDETKGDSCLWGLSMIRVFSQSVERFNAAMPFDIRLPGEDEYLERSLELLRCLVRASLLGQHRVSHQ